MTLQQALLAQSGLRDHIRNGIGAIVNRDRGLISPAERPRVGDSINFDEATREEFPEANRWDYLLSIPGLAELVGLEPHSARDSEVSTVIAKRRHAIDYLRDHLPARYRISKWFWVSRGAVNFSKMERVRRLLDQNGIKFEGRALRSFG